MSKRKSESILQEKRSKTVDLGDLIVEQSKLLNVERKDVKELLQVIKQAYVDESIFDELLPYLLLSDKYVNLILLFWEGGKYTDLVPELLPTMIEKKGDDMVTAAGEVLKKINYNHWFTTNLAGLSNFTDYLYLITGNDYVYNLIEDEKVPGIGDWRKDGNICRTLTQDERDTYFKETYLTFEECMDVEESIYPVNKELIKRTYQAILILAILKHDFILADLIIDHKFFTNRLKIDIHLGYANLKELQYLADKLVERSNEYNINHFVDETFYENLLVALINHGERERFYALKDAKLKYVDESHQFV